MPVCGPVTLFAEESWLEMLIHIDYKVRGEAGGWESVSFSLGRANGRYDFTDDFTTPQPL